MKMDMENANIECCTWSSRHMNHNYKVDLIKLFACFLIMATHLFIIGIGHIGQKDYPFATAWIYVEVFFIISGYFTTQHFSQKDRSDTTLERASICAVSYTRKKYFRLFPYVCCVTFVQLTVYAIHNAITNPGQFGLHEIVSLYKKLPVDILLLNSARAYDVFPDVAPLWYLSAMIIVFPVFCLLIQMKSESFLRILSIIIPIIYYGKYGVNADRTYPNDLLRGFVDLMIGTFVYYTSEELRKRERGRAKERIIFSIIEIVTFLLPVIVTYKNYDMLEDTLIIIVIHLVIVFSGVSFCIKEGKGISKISALSLPIYMWHWVVGTALSTIPSFNLLPTVYKLICYYGATLVVSIISAKIFPCIACKKLECEKEV